MTDFDVDNVRERINALRAYYGAGPTALTDEQIEAGLEIYGAKKHADMVIMVIFDETDVLGHRQAERGVR